LIILKAASTVVKYLIHLKGVHINMAVFLMKLAIHYFAVFFIKCQLIIAILGNILTLEVINNQIGSKTIGIAVIL
jgi:hypothetical protein